jgi:hypothetical protein
MRSLILASIFVLLCTIGLIAGVLTAQSGLMLASFCASPAVFFYLGFAVARSGLRLQVQTVEMRSRPISLTREQRAARRASGDSL